MVAKGILVLVVTVTTGIPGAGTVKGMDWVWVDVVTPEVVWIIRGGWSRDGVGNGVAARAATVGAEAAEITGGGTYGCAALAAGSAITLI